MVSMAARDLRGQRSVDRLGIDHDDVGDRLAPSVSERHLGVRRSRSSASSSSRSTTMSDLLDDHRAELDDVEGLLSPESGLDIGDKLDLDRARHPGLAGIEQPGQDLRQRQNAASKEGFEGDERRRRLHRVR